MSSGTGAREVEVERTERSHIAASHNGVVHARILRKALRVHGFASTRRAMQKQVPERRVVRLRTLCRRREPTKSGIRLWVEHDTFHELLASAATQQTLERRDRRPDEAERRNTRGLAHQRWLAKPALNEAAGDPGGPLQGEEEESPLDMCH